MKILVRTTAVTVPEKNGAKDCGNSSPKGVRLDGTPTQQGVHIHDGKKILVR